MLRPTAVRVCGRCRRASFLLTGPAPASRQSVHPPRPQRRALSHTAVRPRPPPDGTVAPGRRQTLYDYFPEALPGGAPPAGRFAVDVPVLRREFLRLQAAHHPDKHAPEARRAAEATSSAINHAYRTLADPLLRAQYLLSLRGIDVAADETLRVNEPELLHAALAVHEAIEDAAAGRDLVSLARDNDDRIRRCEDSLAHAFAADDVDAAKTEAVRLRYWVNIRDAVRARDEGRPVVLHH